MKEQLVEFETAVLAKERGFDIDTLYFYSGAGKIRDKMELRDDYHHLANYDKQIRDYFDGYYNWNSLPDDNSMHMITAFRESNEYYYRVICSSPEQSLLQKWIRDVHHLHVVIIPTVTCYWTYKIVDVQCDPENEIERPPYKGVNGYDYSTYEDALEHGLRKMLNTIK